jgi:hypothetical protein
MGLTRPKYSQIYDSDAKNSARVATNAGVTLTGGAPNSVDDISLNLKDRVLVKSQANTAQNGIYFVTVVGTGANGTWTRSLDADSNLKLTSGATISVEEGTVNAGKQYRMTSTGTIILGQSAISWTDVSGGGGASTGGTNGQFQYNDNNALNGATYLYYNKTTGQVTANAGTASTTTTSGTFIVSGGAGISGNLVAGGHGQFSGLFNESTTAAGVFIGNAGSPPASPRIGFFNGNTTQNWQIDNYSGTFRWFTPGVTRMELNSAGDLSIPSTTISTSTSTGALKVSGGLGIGGAVRIGGLINVTGSATVGGTLAVTGDTTITGNLTVNGTTTNINTTDLVVEDKNIIIADVATPTNVTADGAGITVKGATDKTFNWVSLTAAWTSSEDLNLLTGKQYEINGTSVLTATTLGSGVVNSSLTSLGTVTNLVATTAVATNISSGNIVATNSTSGTWSTANVSLYESITASTTNATFYPMLSDKTSGNTGSFSATTLTHNPSTGNLTATGHVGNFWGPVAATTANVSSTLSVTGTSAFASATNHAAGITASTVSAGTIGNSGATLTGTLSTAAQPNITSVGTLTSLTTSGNLSVPAASLITGGNIRLGDWPGNTNYTSVQQAGMSGSEYGLLMGKTDKNTYISSWTGGAVNIRGGANSTTCQITVSGSAITITGTLTPAANLTYDLGSTTAWWNNIYGVSVQAKYADLAEHYAADADYPAGTVVVFGGEKEITISTQSHDTAVAGIISTNPAYLMNAAIAGLPVALQGRVPCRVQGPVSKGDVLVTSTTPGVAQRIDNTKFLPGCVVGKALESINTNNIQTIEVVVGRF